MNTGIVLHFQKNLSHCGIILGRVDIGKLTAYHLFDDLLICDVTHTPGAHISTITHNGDIIADLPNLCHLVRNIDQRHPSGFQIPNDAEESRHLIVRKRGGGLIQDHNSCLERHCLGNLHRLHLCNGHGSQFCLGVVRHLHIIQPFRCLLVHLLVIHNLKGAELLCRVAAGIHILRHRSLRYWLQLLMYHGQTLLQGLVRIVDVHMLPIQVDLPLIHMINAKKAFHQGGFSCTVLSHQCMNGARTDFQVDPVQSLYAREAFGNPAHFQSVLCHPILSFHKIRCAMKAHPTFFCLFLSVRIPSLFI